MNDLCGRLHSLLQRLPIIGFSLDTSLIPANGIYVMFENGELGHDIKRIVRIGMHTGANQLRSRMHEHFVNRNKDRSIFRKHIGRALLNKDDDPFLEQWELDLTSRQAKEKHGQTVDFAEQ